MVRFMDIDLPSSAAYTSVVGVNSLQQTRKAVIAHMKNRSYKFSVVVEKDKDGYFAFCSELQGCYTQGARFEDVIKNIKDAIRLHIADRVENGEKIPQSESVCLTTLEVAV